MLWSFLGHGAFGACLDFPIVMECNMELQSELSHPIYRSKGNKPTIVQATATPRHGWVIQGFPLDWAPMSRIRVALKTHTRLCLFTAPHGGRRWVMRLRRSTGSILWDPQGVPFLSKIINEVTDDMGLSHATAMFESPMLTSSPSWNWIDFFLKSLGTLST